MSLYRKYRPQNFANLVGQEHVRTTIINALISGNVNHAYLFTGPRGTGKTSTARLLAKSINCENLQKKEENGASFVEPCEACDICKDITDGRLIDLIEIDAASNRGIDEIRDLREKIQFSPTRAKSKVYIIDEVHMLTKEAFNALLKTLEEPPSHVFFILATTEVHKIPETILSRCQRFDFKRIDDKTLQDRLAFIAREEKIEAEEAALEIIVRSAQGGLRDAIGLLEQLNQSGKLNFKHVQEVLGISGKMSLDNLFEALNKKNVQAGLAEIHALYHEGYDLSQFNKDFLEVLRKKMLASVENGKPQETAWILKLIGYFQQAYEQMRFSTIPQLPLEVAIIQSCLSLNEVAAQPAQPAAQATAQAAPKAATQQIAAKAVPTQVMAEAPAKISTPMVKSPSIESAPNLNIERKHQAITITLEQLKKEWPRVLDKLKTSIGKRTIGTGKILSLENNELKISFQTQFHFSKIKETNVLVDIEEALASVFQTTIKFSPLLAEMTKTIASDNDPEITEEDASKLLEVFGGELVED